MGGANRERIMGRQQRGAAVVVCALAPRPPPHKIMFSIVLSLTLTSALTCHWISDQTVKYGSVNWCRVRM